MSDILPPNVANVMFHKLSLIVAGVDGEGKPVSHTVKDQLEAARLLDKLSSRNGSAKPEPVVPSGIPWIVESLAQVGEFFGKAENTIKVWRERGMPGDPGMPGKSGRYNLKECLVWRDATVGSSGRDDKQDPGEETRADGDRRKSLAEAAIKEMKAAVMRGELIDVDDISREYVHSATHTRAMLEQLPFRFMSMLIDRCPHCGESVYSGDDKRRILESIRGHVDDAVEAVHLCLVERIAEPQPEEETDVLSSGSD